MAPGLHVLRAQALALLAALAAAAGPGAAGAADGPALLGVNLEGVSNWSAQPFFADVIKQGRAFSLPGRWNDPAPVDADGWPTGDASILVGTPPAHLARDAPYRLSFRGRARVTAVGATVRNVAYSAASGRTTADVYVPPASAAHPRESANVALTFKGAPGGVKDVRLLRPGHGDGDLFSRDLLARIAHFSALRFIAWLGPGNAQVTANLEVEWADRGLARHAVQTARAPAWEYVILLANAAGKDAWIAVPYGASDDYLRKLALLFKHGSDGVEPYPSPRSDPVFPPLDPALKLYVEFSNEIWNGVYPTTERNYRDAEAEVAAGDPRHLAWRDGNRWELGWRRYGWQLVRISDAFRAVFGDPAMMTRIRPVLARQLANPATFRQPLSYLRAVFGLGNRFGNPGHPVGHYLYAIAGAPYVDVAPADRGREGLTVDEIFASMEAYAARDVYPAVDAAKALADEYGVRLVAYEGGQHLLPAQGSADAKLAAQRDPRMARMLAAIARRWWDAGGGLFNFYTLCSGWSRSGYWGLSDDIESEATPKWDAVKALERERRAPGASHGG